MTRTQFVFSLGCGSLFMAVGAALALSGTADWGLSLVGAMIAGVTVMSVRPASARSPAMVSPGMSPAES